jgi:hypothetical protein
VSEAVSTLFVPPLVTVFVQFKARGAWFSTAKRVTSNAEMRENGRQPFGLPPENSVCCVAALEHGTTMPCTLRLATTIFRGQREHE